MGDPQPVSCKCAADTARVSPGVKRRHRNKDKMSGKADRTSHGILLAPHSLAILLKIADDERPQSLTRTGRDIFSDFVAQNRNSYWNKDLVSGINRIDYLGWFDPQTLFVQGSEQDLEALRDAWTRRSLRPPRHFVIESLGDVCQVQLAPVSQSHFIPLPDVLCQTIAELNNGKGVATQDNIAEYLQQKFSGVPLPDQDVLHELLGELIKERKVTREDDICEQI
ncbi:maternal placenta development [Branchiostoma belcheri]|nr:maternal placenta development [Branchiostoma belcheri]